MDTRCLLGYVTLMSTLSVVIATWAHGDVTDGHHDYRAYMVLIPDPELRAQTAGYVYGLHFYDTSRTDMLRLAVMKSCDQTCYTVVGMSDIIKTTGSHLQMSAFLSRPVYFEVSDVIALVVGDTLPVPYDVKRNSEKKSRYIYAESYRFSVGDTVNMTEETDGRSYSYAMDTVPEASRRSLSRCILLDFDPEDSGSRRIQSPRYWNKSSVSVDLCWKLTCPEHLLLIISIINFDLQDQDAVRVYQDSGAPDEPLLELTGTIGRSTRYRSAKGRPLYVRYTSQNGKSMFDVMVHTQVNEEREISRQKLIVLVLGVMAAFVLLIFIIYASIRSRKPKSKASDKENENEEFGNKINNLMHKETELNGKIPEIGFKTANGFLMSLKRKSRNDVREIFTGDNARPDDVIIESNQSDGDNLSTALTIDSEVLHALDDVIHESGVDLTEISRPESREGQVDNVIVETTPGTEQLDNNEDSALGSDHSGSLNQDQE